MARNNAISDDGDRGGLRFAIVVESGAFSGPSSDLDTAPWRSPQPQAAVGRDDQFLTAGGTTCDF